MLPPAANVDSDVWPPPTSSRRSYRESYPRDHFCSHTQATAAKSQPTLTSGLSDTNVHTAAFTTHKNIAKTPTRILATFDRLTRHMT